MPLPLFLIHVSPSSFLFPPRPICPKTQNHWIPALTMCTGAPGHEKSAKPLFSCGPVFGTTQPRAALPQAEPSVPASALPGNHGLLSRIRGKYIRHSTGAAVKPLRSLPPQHQLPILPVHQHRIAFLDLHLQDLHSQWILHLALEGTFERAAAVDRAEADFGYVSFSMIASSCLINGGKSSSMMVQRISKLTVS